jgi:hypothetical protein
VPRRGLQRVADVPIYAADALVRRAASLQLTADARAPVAGLPRRCGSSWACSRVTRCAWCKGRASPCCRRAKTHAWRPARCACRRPPEHLRPGRDVRPADGREGLIETPCSIHCTNSATPLLGPALWLVVWSLIKIVAVVLPLMGCVAYLTLWERKGIGWTQIRPAPTASAPTAC